MTFGEKLQALRKARGWSQEELATQINVSRQALSKWESGVSVPDTENVVALSRLFGVSTDYLLLDNGETTAQTAPLTAVPTVESKWPIMRIVWLFTMILAILGKIALRIWASTLPPTEELYGMERKMLTGIKNLSHTYDIGWLLLLMWAMLIAGFAGTVFYKQMREFFVGGWLK